MRLRSILGEALRDVRSGAAGTAVAAAVFAALVGGLLVAGAWQRSSDVRAAEDFVSAGAATLVERADGRVDGSTCAHLTERPDVRAAAAIRRTDAALVPAATPRSPVPVLEVSEGFGEVLGVDTAAQQSLGVLLPRELASTLRVSTGKDLAAIDGAVPVRAVYDDPDDGRVSALSWAALSTVPLDDRAFDECWATIWPEDDESVGALAATVLPGNGEGDPPSLRQLNSTLGSSFSTSGSVLVTAAGPIAAAIAVVVGCSVVLRRRLALASDRHVGVGRGAQLIGQLVQAVVWILPASVVIVLGALVVTLPLGAGDRWPVLVEVIVRTTSAGGAALGGVAIGTWVVRERALLRYFKERA